MINLAKTNTYMLVQNSMLHLFPLISLTRLNPPTNTRTNKQKHEWTNDHADIIVMIIELVNRKELDFELEGISGEFESIISWYYMYYVMAWSYLTNIIPPKND